MRHVFPLFASLMMLALVLSCGRPFFKSNEERKGVAADLVVVQTDEAVRYLNIYDYIHAKFPTVMVTKAGDSYTVRIRGVNSIHGGTDPVFILDGIRLPNLDGVNPADVATVEVVKGPRANTYGDTTNGVIIVTSKRAE